MSFFWYQHGENLYLHLLHSNFVGMPEQADTIARLREAVASVPDRELELWLLSGQWREVLTAAWIIGLKRQRNFHDSVREQLLASQRCYQGQGLCFAMARFESVEAGDALCEYLIRYLPVGEKQYDQEWAIGALAWVDRATGSDKARAFLEDASLWTITDKGRKIGSFNPLRYVEHMRAIMKYIDDIGFGEPTND